MPENGAGADAEVRRDVLGGVTRSNELEDFCFPL
jgi:hypothetical protein